MINNTINAITYLKILFKLIDKNQATHYDIHVFGEILFGGDRAPDRKLNEIICNFIQSLHNKYYLIRGSLTWVGYEDESYNLWNFIRLLHEDCNIKFDLSLDYPKKCYTLVEQTTIIPLDQNYLDANPEQINNDQIMEKEENNKRKYDENKDEASNNNKRQRLN